MALIVIVKKNNIDGFYVLIKCIYIKQFKFNIDILVDYRNKLNETHFFIYLNKNLLRVHLYV